MASSDIDGKKISQLHQELVNAYKKRFICENGQLAVVKMFCNMEIYEKRFQNIP